MGSGVKMPRGVWIRTERHKKATSEGMKKGNQGFKKTTFKIGQIGEKSASWKGDKIKYEGLHGWIRHVKGKPNSCENNSSHKSKHFEWANVARIYDRDPQHYKSLCLSCHRKFDAKNNDFTRVIRR